MRGFRINTQDPAACFAIDTALRRISEVSAYGIDAPLCVRVSYKPVRPPQDGGLSAA
jgi:hypothetical protein